MKKILVTGGCGFIGSNFIRHLFATDLTVEIINLDCLGYAGNARNLADVAGNLRYRFEKGDITDSGKVRQLMADGIDSVIHFAAQSHVDRSIQNAAPFVYTNVVGTQVLLDSVRSCAISRYVHISTDEVYGSLGPLGTFTEESQLAPNNPYAASKAAADLLVRSYVRTFDVPAIITRSSNNYGPNQHPEKLIPLFITSLLRDEPVPVYGDGQQVRDWVHVLDHCRAIERVWRHGQVGEIYNIGGGNERTNLELAQFLLQILNKPDSLIRFVPDRPGHDRRYALDCAKIRNDLNWHPTVCFREGIQATVRWYQENVGWFSREYDR